MKEQYFIIRTVNAGVFAGNIKFRKGSEVQLTNVRKLHYWDGAAAIQQLAIDGTKKPNNCRFTMTVDEMTVLGVIEIIPCTEVAEQNIKNVPVWKI